MVMTKNEMEKFNSARKKKRDETKLEFLEAKVNRLENCLCDLCFESKHGYIQGKDLLKMLKKYGVVM